MPGLCQSLFSLTTKSVSNKAAYLLIQPGCIVCLFTAVRSRFFGETGKYSTGKQQEWGIWKLSISSLRQFEKILDQMFYSDPHQTIMGWNPCSNKTNQPTNSQQTSQQTNQPTDQQTNRQKHKQINIPTTNECNQPTQQQMDTGENMM